MPKTLQHGSEKWLKYFLTEREIGFMRELRSSLTAVPLSSHGGVDVGVVTGKNEFFVLSEQQVEEYQIAGFTIPLISRSIQLKGSIIKKVEWRRLSSEGDRVHLLDLKSLNGSKLPKPLKAYIRLGESAGHHQGYKCSIREPWYAVPSIWTPQGFLFRQIYDFPRFVLNRADATSTDTIHRFSCTANAADVIANTYTYLTAASAEIEGRSYGGGVLELEPTEAERLMMPARIGNSLPLNEIDKLIRQGNLEGALDENSRLVLTSNMGLSARDCSSLRDIWVRMRDRRLARRKTSRKAPTSSPTR
jgi:adenine-specific DNA methylase